jgi:uncharacterized protein
MNSRPRRTIGILLACSGVGLGACTAHASGPSVEIRGHHFQIEIAADDAARQRGLMFRDSLAEDHGMLFLFEQPGMLTFWMKNTHIPLDILYFDQNYKLVSVQQRVPPCRSAGNDCPTYPSAGPAQYVLELNAGMTEKLGITPGDKLTVTR